MTSLEPHPANIRFATDCIGRAKALAPKIAAAASRIERERELPPEIVAALQEAGLFRMLVPRSLGGGEVSASEFVQAVEEIAKADASTAWCVAQTSICSTIASAFSPETGRGIFGKGDLLAWGPANPTGRAVADGAGFRITGQWQFASGSRHAAWFAAHCPVFEADGTPRLMANGQPDEITAVFPKSEAAITDVWQVMGLKGTGSDNYAVSDLFVPSERTVNSYARDPAKKHEHGPLYQFTVFQLFGAGFAGIALGIARSALDAFVELAKGKTPMGGKSVLRDNAVVQSQIGQAEAKLAGSRVFLLHALDAMGDSAGRPGGITVDQRISLRMAASLATHNARDVVDAAYHGAGATAVFESNPFERRFRDVHTVSQQVQSHFALYESIGQHFLGLPLHPKFI